MATTTNYGWTTPDDTALVKDGAAAIRSLGTSVDTTTKNLNPSTTLGDIEYRSSTANTNTRLAIGSTGNVLTVAGGVPTWAAPAGGGKVLQVVQGTASTDTTISTSTFTDTGLTATITPSSASSKILVILTQPAILYMASTTAVSGKYQLLRGATAIWTQPDDSLGVGAGGNGANYVLYNWLLPLTYLDSPATTSATTYKTQGARNHASNYIRFNEGGDGQIILMEIGA